MVIIDLILKSVLVCLCGLLGVGLMRRTSSSARHLVLVLTLIGLCALPVVWALLPAWHVPFFQLPVEAHTAAASAIAGETANFNPAPLLFAIWSGVALILCGRLAVRLERLQRLEKGMSPNTDLLVSEVVEASEVGQAKEILILVDPQNTPPMTWGHIRPRLCLPASAIEWSSQRLEAVILHELAHIQRNDWLTSVVSEVVCAVFWFNPLVWVLKSRISWESEAAADDQVLAAGIPGPEYASFLVDLVRELQAYPRFAEASLALSRPAKLEKRVLNILEPKRSRRRTNAIAAVGLLAGVAGVVISVGTAAPTLVEKVERSVSGQSPDSADVELISKFEPSGQASKLSPSYNKEKDLAINSASGGSLVINSGGQSVDIAAPKRDNKEVEPAKAHVDLAEPQVDSPELHVDPAELHVDPPEVSIQVPDTDADADGSETDKALAEASGDLKKAFADMQKEMVSSKFISNAVTKALSEAKIGLNLAQLQSLAKKDAKGQNKHAKHHDEDKDDGDNVIDDEG